MSDNYDPTARQEEVGNEPPSLGELARMRIGHIRGLLGGVIPEQPTQATLERDVFDVRVITAKRGFEIKKHYQSVLKSQLEKIVEASSPDGGEELDFLRILLHNKAPNAFQAISATVDTMTPDRAKRLAMLNEFILIVSPADGDFVDSTKAVEVLQFTANGNEATMYERVFATETLEEAGHVVTTNFSLHIRPEELPEISSNLAA